MGILFSAAWLQDLGQVLGTGERAISPSALDLMLKRLKMIDVAPNAATPSRIAQALAYDQIRRGNRRGALQFIRSSMHQSCWDGRIEDLTHVREQMVALLKQVVPELVHETTERTGRLSNGKRGRRRVISLPALASA